MGGWCFSNLSITSVIASKRGPARSGFHEDEANKSILHFEHRCRERGGDIWGTLYCAGGKQRGPCSSKREENNLESG